MASGIPATQGHHAAASRVDEVAEEVMPVMDTVCCRVTSYNIGICNDAPHTTMARRQGPQSLYSVLSLEQGPSGQVDVVERAADRASGNRRVSQGLGARAILLPKAHR